MASGEWGVKDTTALIPVIQNVWAPYLTMRHVLLESFVWEEANRVPFLIREFSYDRDPRAVLYTLHQFLMSSEVREGVTLSEREWPKRRRVSC